METPVCEEKCLCDKITSLVDYSSSSEDEDEEAASLVKKQRLGDSGSDGDGHIGCDANEEKKTEACFQSQTDFDDTFSDDDDDDDSYWKLFNYHTDHEVLTYGRYSWRSE